MLPVSCVQMTVTACAYWLCQAYEACTNQKEAETLLENIEVRNCGLFFL